MLDTNLEEKKRWIASFIGVTITGAPAVPDVVSHAAAADAAPTPSASEPSGSILSATDLAGPPAISPGSAPSQAAPAAPRLALLGPDDKAKCTAYLDAHLGAGLLDGRPGTDSTDYQPTLDGKPATLDNVVDAILPLTLFGGPSNDPTLEPGRTETRAELTDLARGRYDAIVARKVADAAKAPTAPDQPKVLRLPPNLTTPSKLNDVEGWNKWKSDMDDWWKRYATVPPNPGREHVDLPDWLYKPLQKPPTKPEWKQWADAADDFFKKYHIDPKPFVDTLKDLLKLPDDGDDSPLKPHKTPDDPTPDEPAPLTDTKYGKTDPKIDPAAKAPADPPPSPPVMPDNVTVVLLDKLKRDLSDACVKAIAAAQADDKAMRDLAASKNIALNNPGARVASIADGLPDDVKIAFQQSLNALDTKRVDIESAINAMQNARDRLAGDIHKLNATPDPHADSEMPKDVKPGDDSQLGDTVEHIWDGVNQLLKFVPIIGTVQSDLLQAIAGTDFVKDGIKGLFSVANETARQIATAMGKTNQLLISLKQAAQQDIDRDKTELQRAVKTFAELLKSLTNDASLVGQLMDKYLKGRGKSSDKDDTMAVMKAVDKAHASAQSAATLLNSESLAPRTFNAWFNQLVPPGELVSDGGPATGGPGTVVGSFVVYKKNSTNFAYRETKAFIEEVSGHLAAIKTFYGSDVEAINDAWSAAFRDALKLK
jgi:hypothetical protein